MKRKYLYIIVSAIVLGVAAGGAFLTYDIPEFLQNALLTSKDNAKTYVSPFKLLPYVSRAEVRKTICGNVKIAPFKSICNKKYNAVKPDDVKKIDALILELRKADKSKKLSPYNKFLAAQLIFATLPAEKAAKVAQEQNADSSVSRAGVMNTVLMAQAGNVAQVRTGMTRAQYEQLLLNDLAEIKANCPKDGYENWNLQVMCSEYAWVNGVKQPIYSKEYAEAGGPCVFSEAGAMEEFHVNSRVNTKMASEYNFSDNAGISTQIACSFSCGSYRCPRLESELGINRVCKNPIYIPMYGYPKGHYLKTGEIPAARQRIADEEAQAECEERGYDYKSTPGGTTSRTKVRNCTLTSSGSGEIRQDPPDYKPTYHATYCCSCARPVRDPYTTTHDFTEPGYTGRDLVKYLLDGAKRVIRDATSLTPKVDDKTPPQTPQPSLPTTPETPPSTQSTSTPPPSTTSTPPPASPSPATVTPAEEEPPAKTKAYVRFTCSVTKKREGGALNVHLDSRTTAVDAAGNPDIYGNLGGGWGGIGAYCDSLESEVAVCIDPRTNTLTDGPLDFIKEFSLTNSTEENQRVHTAWFNTMTLGKRKCNSDELPTGN